MGIQIVEGTLEEALDVLRHLTEFERLGDNNYYFDKIHDRDHLVLIAKIESEIVGCKVGYDKFNDGSFYSWLGGVIPEYREAGVARKLASTQEEWAKEKGYVSIKFKTLNRHKGMIIFAIKNGFEMYNIKPKDELEDYRIQMTKELL